MEAPSSTPISEWIASIKDGDSSAQTKLWERYYHQLVAMAHRKLKFTTGREGFDGEDITQSVFLSLFLRAEEGKFPELNDRNGLWRLLIVMTERRVSTNLRSNNTLKRGGKIKHQPIHLLPSMSQHLSSPQNPTPTENMTDELVDTVREVLGECDGAAKDIAALRMEGYDIAEIALKVGVSQSTVNRKIRYLKERLQAAIRDS